MDDRDRELIRLLNIIISQLAQPLTAQEKQCEWRQETKQGWLKLMQGYLEKLQAGKFRENQEEEINLGYGLGYEGIAKGELARMIVEFDNKWNEKYAEKPAWWWKRKEGKLGKLGDPPRKNFK